MALGEHEKGLMSLKKESEKVHPSHEWLKEKYSR